MKTLLSRILATALIAAVAWVLLAGASAPRGNTLEPDSRARSRRSLREGRSRAGVGRPAPGSHPVGVGSVPGPGALDWPHGGPWR